MKQGELLLRKIGDATGRHDVVIALISSQSVMTDWVRSELIRAMTTDIGGRRFTVFPVVINTCEAPPFWPASSEPTCAIPRACPGKSGD